MKRKREAAAGQSEWAVAGQPAQAVSTHRAADLSFTNCWKEFPPVLSAGVSPLAVDSAKN